MGLDAYRAAQRFSPPLVLGRELSGVVSWNINDTCNYRCSYCTQRLMPNRSYRLREIEAYLRAFTTLPGAWEIKLSGGEPFTQPGLEQIAAELVARGHVVSIQTNFSATPERLSAFLEATRGALHLFSASLHLEYDTKERFLARYQRVKPYEIYGLRFHVTSVATPARVQELYHETRPFFAQHGVVFKVQPEKIDGRLSTAYTAEELSLLGEMGGHNLSGAIAANHQGRLCYAGTRYLVIKSNGQAYRCYPASRQGGRYAHLGSFPDGITLDDRARPCPYTYCNCTVPIQRGMVLGHKGGNDVRTLPDRS